MLPKTVNGALQWLGSAGCENNENALKAIEAFLASKYGVPKTDLDVNCAPLRGGRRLAVGANANYVIRYPSNTTVTPLPATTNFAFDLNAEFLDHSAGIVVTDAFLPTPVQNEPGVNTDKVASTTKAFPTLTPGIEPEPELA